MVDKEPGIWYNISEHIWALSQSGRSQICQRRDEIIKTEYYRKGRAKEKTAGIAINMSITAGNHSLFIVAN